MVSSAEVLIGMGATILNRAVIGRGSVVGAGALVLEGMEVPPFSLVVGSPAKAWRSSMGRIGKWCVHSMPLHLAAAKTSLKGVYSLYSCMHAYLDTFSASA